MNKRANNCAFACEAVFGHRGVTMTVPTFRRLDLLVTFAAIRGNKQGDNGFGFASSPYLHVNSKEMTDSAPMELEILYQDEHLVAINKPHGLLVHRSPIASDVHIFALQLLREQIGKKVFPVHRLDRKTAGVLLFTLSRETLVNVSNQFMAGTVRKKYLAIVRGYTPPSGVIDYPLVNDAGISQDAVTRYTTLGHGEIPYALGKHETQRYSLVLAEPETGRKHQLRKHFSHIFHPIIADRPGGCNKQNRFFKEQFQMDTMLLHALNISFAHPVSSSIVNISAPISSEFQRMLTTLNLEEYFISYIS